jgi:cytochrome P450
MTSAAESAAGSAGDEVRFDPFEPGFIESPHGQYARLRAADPVHWSELLEGWVLTRYDDCFSLLRDTSISVDLDKAAPTRTVEMQRERQARSDRDTDTLVLRDDPDHQRLRKLMQRPFGPRPVEGLRAMVADRVDQALDELAPRGAMDVVADFAYPLPVGIFNDMLGLPADDSPRIQAWIGAVARLLDPVIPDEEHDELQRLMDELYDYLRDQAEAKRAEPSDDVLSALVHAEEEGDRLSHSELVAQLVTLYVAGHEPTTTLIGNGLLSLLRHPDQLALLRSRPELLPNAAHELLRYDGPNQFVRRIATQPLHLGDRRIAPGDVLYPCLAAANRDPARWDDADAVRVERADASQHLQFGSGVHTCLGTHVARLIAELALGALLTRLPDIELTAEPEFSDRMVLRSVRTLPIRWS